MSAEETAILVGGEFVRWPLPCDFCHAVPGLRTPTLLAFWSDAKARHLISCRDEGCLSKALDAHTAEQPRVDRLVEERQSLLTSAATGGIAA